MTPPHEQTWSAFDPDDDGDDCAVMRLDSNEPLVENGLYLAEAKLISAAPEMVRVLLACEWEATWVGDHPSCCPSCYGAKPDTYVSGNVGGVPASKLGHTADCRLDAALRKAGVR